MVDVIPGDDIRSPCGHGRANSEGETLVKRLAEQGQHLVALRAVREVGHPCGARIPNSWVWVFSLGGGGSKVGNEQLGILRPPCQWKVMLASLLSVHAQLMLTGQEQADSLSGKERL